MERARLQAEVGAHTWYHTIELAPGVVTGGMFDHRPVVDRYLLPPSLTGMRCLDVGTFEGFWAFEMERRGAAEVVAIDVTDPEQYDWPASLRASIPRGLGVAKEERFALARDALGSSVQYVQRSVYELEPEHGPFDLVFCGDLLVHLKDPVSAVERIRGVTAGSAILANPIKRFWWARHRPMAQIDGIDEFEWWGMNLPGLVRLARAAGFGHVEAGRPFALPATGGGRWRGLRGVVRCRP